MPSHLGSNAQRSSSWGRSPVAALIGASFGTVTAPLPSGVSLLADPGYRWRMKDDPRTDPTTDGDARDRDQHIDPEPLDVDVEDVFDAFPEGEPPVPPSEAQAPAP